MTRLFEYSPRGDSKAIIYPSVMNSSVKVVRIIISHLIRNIALHH